MFIDISEHIEQIIVNQAKELGISVSELIIQKFTQPQIYRNVKTLNGYLTPFPNIDTIFVEHQSWLKEHFLPLISIDLGMINSEWGGQVVHMINPFEPEDGVIGGWTDEFHNEFTGENWLAFRLTDNNRYEFLGDEGYFIRSPIHGDEVNENFEKDIAKSIKKYQAIKEFYAKNGYLADNWNAKSDDETERENWLESVGGELENNAGNWSSDLEMPQAFFGDWDDDEGLIISHNDNPFYFIASVPAYNYGCDGADWIVLLYEPISKIVLFTFDWT